MEEPKDHGDHGGVFMTMDGDDRIVPSGSLVIVPGDRYTEYADGCIRIEHWNDLNVMSERWR